jgi:hypothetical protein
MCHDPVLDTAFRSHKNIGLAKAPNRFRLCRPPWSENQTCQSREPGHGQQPAWSYRRGSTRTTRRHSKTWCDPHRNADRTGNLGKLEAGRAKHMVTHILRRFTVKPILFALPRTNKFGLEN